MHDLEGDRQSLIEQLDSQFDTLTLAANNRNYTLKQLTSATTTQYAMIQTSLKNLASNSPTGNNHTNPRPAPRKTPPLLLTKNSVLEKEIKLLQAAYKNKWVVGGICSTQGHGFGAGHKSVDFAGKRNKGKTVSHNNSATHSNPDRPSKDHNKGWDDWLL